MNAILRKLLLSLLTIIAISPAMAQNRTPKEVDPASNGVLPTEFPTLAQAEPGRFGGLELDRLTYYTGWSNRHEAWLKFPYATSYGGEYYTLQYRESTEEAWQNSEGTFEYDNATPTMYTSTYYRIVLHGGPMDGYVSNEIYVPFPVISKCFVKSWFSRGGYDQLMVGNQLNVCSVTVWKYNDPNPDKDESGKSKDYKTYTNDSGCYTYQWYRRNPNTGEMTAIEGATGESYVTTVNDVGYEIVEMVKGDDQTLSFIQTFNHSVVRMAIQSSIAYIDNNGFILNTEYEIPEPAQNLCLSTYDETKGDYVAKPFGDALRIIKPGQYAITMDRSLYDYNMLTYATEPYNLSFVYEMPIWGEGEEPIGYELMFREAQLMADRYMYPLQIKPLLNGNPTATAIDILGKGIDGKFGVVATLAPEEANDGTFYTGIFPGKYYVKAHPTDGTMETYYPNGLIWQEGDIVEPEAESWDEGWEPTCATINLVEAPAALTGNSVIEGTITVKSKARARTRGGDGESYTVYLKEKETGKIIAQAQTDASGNYKFENVPIGDYFILPNIDGYKIAKSAPLEVKVTQENQTITNADCTVVEASLAEIFKEPVEGEKGDANGDGTVNAADIVEVVNYIMGSPSDNFKEALADANGDGTVNAADIVTIVNTIMGN